MLSATPSHCFDVDAGLRLLGSALAVSDRAPEGDGERRTHGIDDSFRAQNLG